LCFIDKNTYEIYKNIHLTSKYIFNIDCFSCCLCGFSFVCFNCIYLFFKKTLDILTIAGILAQQMSINKTTPWHVLINCILRREIPFVNIGELCLVSFHISYRSGRFTTIETLFSWTIIKSLRTLSNDFHVMCYYWLIF
jgi:hypothetical protein